MMFPDPTIPRPSYQMSEAIKISSDLEFIQKATELGWQGNGSAESPYIITNMHIRDPLINGEELLSISHVSLYFKILNNIFENNASFYSRVGIDLFNCSHLILISNNEFIHTNNGDLKLYSLKGTIISDLEADSVYVRMSSDIVIEQCEINELHLDDDVNITLRNNNAIISYWSSSAFKQVCKRFLICENQSNKI